MKHNFYNDLPHKCEYCHLSYINDAGELTCQNPKPDATLCKAYIYDPFKRIPHKAELKKEFTAADFAL